MRNIISTALLILVTGSVIADGFYQHVVGNSPQSNQQVNGEATEFTYTPLYHQVTSSVKKLVEQKSIGPRTEFTYTPLYLQVVGPEKPWLVMEEIAQTHAKNEG